MGLMVMVMAVLEGMVVEVVVVVTASLVED